MLPQAVVDDADVVGYACDQAVVQLPGIARDAGRGRFGCHMPLLDPVIKNKLN
jgi:hypothetical protein